MLRGPVTLHIRTEDPDETSFNWEESELLTCGDAGKKGTDGYRLFSLCISTKIVAAVTQTAQLKL